MGVAVGNSSRVKASVRGSTFGTHSTVENSNGGTALGARSSVTNATRGTAIGMGATTSNITGGVALGAYSKADRAALNETTRAATATPTVANNQVYALSSANADDKTAIEATVKGNLGAVSVGGTVNDTTGDGTVVYDGTATRQIINVAAGSENSDAVNVAQLKAVAKVAESKIGDNTFALGGNNNTTTATQALSKTDGLKFNIVGANNGQYITTNAAGDNVTVDLSDDAKVKLNSTVTVEGSGAAKVSSKETKDSAGRVTNTTYTVHVDPVSGGTASTEQVVKKAAAAGDTNIAEVNPASGSTQGGAGATYEVGVSKNAVKDAAREAVIVNNGGNTDNPITVTPNPDETTHTTTYNVTFDGSKAAKQIPLTYKANGANSQTVTLDKGLDFTNGNYTTATVAADGVVKYDVKLGTTPAAGADGKPGKDGTDGNATATVVKPGDTVNYKAGDNLTVKQEIDAANNAQTYTFKLNKDLTGISSITNGGSSITLNPTPGNGNPAVTINGGDLNLGGNKITNLKPGTATTDAATVGQLTVVKSSDNSVSVQESTNANGGKVYDLKVTGTGTASDPDTYFHVNTGAITGAAGTTAGGNTGTGNGSTNLGKIGEAAGAKGAGAVTAGINASGEGRGSVALGQASNVSSHGGVAIGRNATVVTPLANTKGTDAEYGKSAVAIGEDSKVAGGRANNGSIYGRGSIAIGTNALANRVLENGIASDTNNAYKTNTGGLTGVNNDINLSIMDLAGMRGDTGHSNEAVALGTDARAVGDQSIAIGAQVVAGHASVAIGGNDMESVATTANKATYQAITGAELPDNQIGSAYPTTSAMKGSVAIGEKTYSRTLMGTAIGLTAAVNENAELGTALGVAARVGNQDSKVASQGATAIGAGAVVEGNYSTAIGTGTQVIAVDATSIGYKNKVTGNNSVSIGDNQTVSTSNSVVLGSGAAGNLTATKETQGTVPLAGGGTFTYGGYVGAPPTDTSGALQTGYYVSVGTQGAERQIKNVAAGKVSADSTDAINGSQLYATNKVVADLSTNNIKLGSNSGTTDAQALNKNGGLQFNVKGDGTYVTTKAAGTDVTVDLTQETKDKIENAANKNLSNITNEGAKNITKLGTIVKAGDNVTVTDSSDPTTGRTTYTVNAITPAVYTDKAGNKVYPIKDAAGNTTWNTKPDGTGTVVTTDNVITSFESPAGSTTDGGKIVNNIGSAIQTPGSTDTFLTQLDKANGATPNAAVNVSDLKNTSDALKASELHIAPTVTNRTGETVGGTASGNTATGAATQAYKYDPTTKQVVMTYNDGAGKAVSETKAVIDLSNLPTGGSMDSFNVKSSATGGTVAAGSATTAQAIKDGKTVEMQAGKNLTIKQTNTTDGNAQVEYSLNKDLTGLDSIGINGKDGKDGLTIKGGDGKPGVDGTNITRIEYVDKDGNKQDVATLNDGMKYAGDNGQADATKVINKKLNERLDIVGGADASKLTDNNIGVNAKDGKLEVKLVRDIDLTKDGSLKIGDTTVNNGGLTINNGPSVTNKGIDAGSKTITNVMPGVNGTDAVNVNQLKATEQHIKPGTYTVGQDGNVTMTYVDGNGADVANQTAVITGVAKSDLSNITNEGETKIKNLAKTAIDMEDGKNTKASDRDVNGVKTFKVDVEGDLVDISSITNSEGSGKINLNPNGVVQIGGNNPINLDGSKGNIGGLTNKTFDPNNFTSGQAATEDQLKVVHDTLKASELHIAPTNVKAGSTEALGGTANNGTNTYVYDPTTKQVVMTYNDGNGKAVSDTKAVIDLSNLPTGGSMDSFNVKSSATDGTVAAGSQGVQAITDGKTVEMQAGKNLTIKQTNENGNAKVEYSLADDIVIGKDGQDGVDGKIGVNGKDGSAVVINGKDGSIGLNGKDGANGITIKGDKGEPGVNGGNGITRIVYERPDPSDNTKTIREEVATLNDGLKFTGNNTDSVNKNKLNTLVTIEGEGVSKAESATFQSASGNINVVANGQDGNQSKLTIQLNKNLKGLESVTTKEIKLGDENNNTSIKKDGDRITYTTPDGNGGTTVNKIANLSDEIHITDTTYTVGDKTKRTDAKDDEITLTYTDGNGQEVANKFAIIQGVAKSDLSNITDEGKKNITKLGTVVKAGDNVTVTSNADGDGRTTYTVNAITPAIYTDKNGNKVYPITDATGNTTWNTQPNGSGTTIDAGDVITSFTTPTGDTKGGTMIVNNVGSAINTPGSTGDFLTKLDTANTATPNAVVNVSDLKNTADGLTNKGLRFDANSGGEKTNKLGSKVTIQGTGDKADTEYNTNNIKTIISQDQTTGDTTINIGLANDIVLGKPGQDGKDGSITVMGKDGNGVVVDGKDGSISAVGKDGTGVVINGEKGTIGIAGKDGKDGINITNNNSKVGLDGADGSSRIVYTDKDGKTNEVATMNDGLKFTGNNEDTVNKHKLNSLVKVQGEGVNKATSATFQSAAGNINVKADGKDLLEIQLNKDLQNINSIKNTANGPSITIGGNDITIGGGNLNMDGNKITNLAPGTDGTDAVNVDQLNKTVAANKTIVKAGDNVTVTSATATDGATTYTVNAITPAVYTDKDGNKVYPVKDANGNVTWNTQPDGSGTTVNAGDIITSFESPAGSTTDGGTIVNNIGSAIQGKDGDTFLDKLDNANNSNPNSAVNVSDLKNTADAIGNKGLNFTADNTNAGDANTTVHRNLGDTLKIEGDSNITTTADNANGKISLALSNNIQIGEKGEPGKDGQPGKPGVDGTIGVNGKDGSSVVINGKDGSIGLTGPKGADGKDGASATISVKDGKPGVDGKDGETKTRVVYERPDPTDPSKTITEEVATLNDGLRFTGNNTDKENIHKLNSTVKVQGERTDGKTTYAAGESAANNLIVEADGGSTLTVKMAKDLNLTDKGSVKTGNTTVNNDGITITNPTDPAKNVSLTNGGLNNGGNKIINVAEGTDDTDAVNVKQLKDTIEKNKTHLVDGKNTTVTGTGTADDPYKVNVNDNVVFGKDGKDGVDGSIGVTGKDGNAVVIDGKDGSISAIGKDGTGVVINGKDGSVGIAGKDGSSANITTKDSAVGLDGKDGSSRIVYTDKDGKENEVATMNDGLKFTGNNEVVNNHKLNSTVTIKGEGVDKAASDSFKSATGNINVKADGKGTLEVQLNKDLNLTKDGSVTTGNTTVNNDGITITNPTDPNKTVSLTDKNLNNGGNQIINQGSGATGTDADGKPVYNNDTNGANIGDVKNIAGDIVNNSGWKANATGNVVGKSEATKVTPNTTVNFDAGNNLEITQTIDAKNNTQTYSYRLKDDIQLGQPGKDGKDGSIGVNGKDGSGVVINGKDGSIGLTGPKGADGKDGASATISVKDGKPGVDGKDGDTKTRIVYETKDANGKPVTEEVATLNDGLKFTGNNTDTTNIHKLNTTVKVQGEGVSKEQSANFKSAAGNINVVANGSDTLEVRLNKDLQGINTITNGDSSITLNENPANNGGNAVTINGGNLNMGGNKITNLKPGTDKTDAATVGQMTQVTSNNKSVQVIESINDDGAKVYDLAVNPAIPNAIDELGREIGRVGAQGAALAALKPIQYDPLEPTQIMAGYGNYRGNSALALGVAHYKNESTMIHGGISWATGDGRHMMANAGVTWKIGNRDSEAAIADRYRKGPISSAYAMQNEMAAMKAENAGLKGEVADLKAQNEEMKAKIEAMMAKLGL
ncbi:YadA-like family protein [Veillonella agrestimuris]|uniref:YadA-like family protein n=1 Tax=Veillonella agrestimuris TaxID=2941340 RepID=UPI00203D937D|nr:YadA-like family protein [Veillonella agrestimuris]